MKLFQMRRFVLQEKNLFLILTLLSRQNASFESISGLDVIKLCPCSIKLSMEFFLLMNVLAVMSRKIAFQKMLNFLIFYTYKRLKFHAQLS